MGKGRSRTGAITNPFASGRLARTSVGVPPPPPFHTGRSRLFERLDKRRQITTVFGPAGFGKTTLISGWLAQARDVDKVAWVALDEHERDVHILAAQWLEAIRMVRPDACEVAYSMLHDARAPRSRAIFTAILNDVSTLKDDKWLFIVDDYPPDDSQLDELLTFVGDRLPDNIELAIVSRGEPSLPLGRWRVKLKLTEIDLEELRFTTEETREFIGGAMKLQLEQESLELLERRVEGWAAGLQLAALWLTGKRGEADQPDLDIMTFDARHRFVADYLAEEILTNQDDATRRFLLATSVVDKFTSSLCDAILESANSRVTLDKLKRRALFVVALDDQKQWHRYHHLFRDFLRSHVDPEDAVAIHRRASDWYERENQPGEAIRHAIAARDLARAVTLVKDNVDAQLAEGEFHQLLRWLDALPDDVVREDIELSGYRAWLLYMRGRLGEAEALLEHITSNEASGKRSGPLMAFKAFLAINRGRIKEAEQAANAAVKNLTGSRSFFSGLAMLLLGGAQRIAGNRTEAQETLRSAVRLAEAHGNLMVRLEATSDLVPLMYSSGKLREAVQLCALAIEGSAGNPRGLTTAGPLHIRFGQLLYELDERDRAKAVLERGVDLCNRLGNISYVYLGKRHLARLAYANGRADQAYELLAEAAHFADQAEHARQRYLVDVVAAEFRLREGNVAIAANLLGTSTDWAEKTTDFEQLVYVRLLLAQNRPRTADAVLARLEGSARKNDRLGRVFIVLLLRGLSAEARGEKTTAERLVTEALALGAPAGYIRSLLDLGEPIRRIVERVKDKSSFAVRYLDRFERGPEDDEEEGESGPLTNTEHAILELLAQGMTNRDIADRLSITVGTAKWHIHHIYQKLEVASRTAAVYRAREMRILQR